MKYRKSITISWLAALLVSVTTFVSCNEKSNSDIYESPVNLAVTSFYLKNIGQQELDTVFFSIDLKRKLIFNADSLRKGTDVSKVVAMIRFSNDVSEAVIEMDGGTTREGEINYQKAPGDSIDFTGNVRLRVKADKDQIGTVYTIKVNVHKCDPDSLFWNETAVAKLPSRLASPRRQKTVELQQNVISMIEEADGSYTLATCASPAEYSWQKKSVALPFTPRIETLTATEETLWMLSDDNHLYASTDLSSWFDTGEVWQSMIGSYVGTVVGIKDVGGVRTFAQHPRTTINEVRIPEDFPIEGSSNFVTLINKWTSSPVAFMTGGRAADGSLSDDTWAFDGAEWIRLSSGGIPALRDASIVPYYNYRASAKGNVMIEYKVWMLLGGRHADGSFNRTVYVSYDNGVNWAKGAASLQLPDCIPAMSGFDNIVAESQLEANISDAWTQVGKKPQRISYQIDGDVIAWECPYIYLFGGYAADGSLYDNVWKGVLMRLTFTPII